MTTLNDCYHKDNADFLKSSIGKTIKSICFAGDELEMVFSDNTKMRVFDDGQSCCEKRYTVCDDNLEPFVGSKLLNISVSSVDRHNHHDDEQDYEEHEIAFCIVTTSIGTFTLCSHNEHNGYYGGFNLVTKEIK